MAEPSTAGTYWFLGDAVNPSGAANDVIEFNACVPQKVVVIAAPTAGTTAAATDLTTTEALANALKADIASIRTALATGARLKML